MRKYTIELEVEVEDEDETKDGRVDIEAIETEAASMVEYFASPIRQQETLENTGWWVRVKTIHYQMPASDIWG